MGVKGRLCVDIGNSAVKALVGAYRNGRFHIYDAHKKKMDIIVDPCHTVSIHLKETLWEMGIQRAVFSSFMCSGDTAIRFINMPSKTRPRSIYKQISEGITKYVPWSKDETYFDFLPLAGQNGFMPLMVFFAKHQMLELYDNIARKAGFRLGYLGIDAVLMNRLFKALYPLEQGPICIADIGKKWTKIVIIQDGGIRFARTVMLAGQDIDFLIKERLGVSLDTAALVKEGENSIVDVITLSNKVLNYITEELFVSLDYYESQFGAWPEKVYLSGGVSKMKGIAEYFEDKLNTDVELLKIPESRFVFSNLSIKDKFLKDEASYLLSLALLVNGR